VSRLPALTEATTTITIGTTTRARTTPNAKRTILPTSFAPDSSGPPLRTAGDEQAEHQERGDHQQDQAEGRAEVEIGLQRVNVTDDVRDERKPAQAQDGGHVELGEVEEQHHRSPAGDAGTSEGNEHMSPHPGWGCPQVGCV